MHSWPRKSAALGKAEYRMGQERFRARKERVQREKECTVAEQERVQSLVRKRGVELGKKECRAWQGRVLERVQSWARYIV